MTTRTSAALLTIIIGFAAAGSAHASLGELVKKTTESKADSILPVAANVGSAASAHEDTTKISVHASTTETLQERQSNNGHMSGATSSETGGKDNTIAPAPKSSALKSVEVISVFRKDSGSLGDVHAKDDTATSSPADGFKRVIKSALHSDPDLQAVTADEHGMNLQYRETGHFLGIIPAHLVANIHIASDGTVTVHYPWYVHLMTIEHSATDLTTALSIAVTANMNAVGATASSTNSLKATSPLVQIFSRIEAILHGDMPATASS